MSEPTADLPFGHRKAQRDKLATVLSFIFSPVTILVSGFNLVSEAIDRRYMSEKLDGVDEKVSTREIMQGEGAAFVGIIGGGLSGVILTNLLSTDSQGNPWDMYLWFLAFVLVAALVVLSYKWMRWQMRLATTGAWEPGVPPRVAMESLRNGWTSQSVKTIWPGTVRSADAERVCLTDLVRHNLWHVIVRAGFWTLAPVVLFLVSSHSWPSLILCAAIWIVSLLGIGVSLQREQTRTRFSVRTAKARYEHLENEIRIAASAAEERGIEKEILDVVAANFETLKKLEEKTDRTLDSPSRFSL